MDYTIHLLSDFTGLWSREKITPGYKTAVVIDGASEATVTLESGGNRSNYKAVGGVVTLPLSAWQGENISVSVTAKRGFRTVTWNCGTLKRNPSGLYEVEKVSAYDVLLKLRLECEELRKLIESNTGNIKNIKETISGSYIVEGGKNAKNK